MEVHQHTHSTRKKWHHYFWEFFMLFLAVTLGFFVENIREHLADRKKEKSYISSLIADLKNDTTTIRQVTKVDFKLLHGEDSLVDLLSNFKDNDSISRKCYRYYFLYATSYFEMTFNERTMSQLLNTGNMRLIHRQSISDSIMDYNFLVKYVQAQGKAYEEYFKRTLDFSNNIFDFTYTRNYMHEDYSITPKLHSANITFILLTKEPATIKKYTIQLTMLQGILEQNLLLLRSAKEKATRLIALLQKEYNMK
jgi:hypothetical protein